MGSSGALTMITQLVILCFVAAVHVASCTAHAASPGATISPQATAHETSVASFLQSEISSCSAAQQAILFSLQSKHVHIGSAQTSKATSRSKGISSGIRERIAQSTKERGVECRVALGTAPIGAKCVAPCACTGSQKWVQFSELNRLRRKDPQQWAVCRTCQQRFEYDMFAVYGGLPANLIGYALDHPGWVRAAVASVSGAALYFLSAHMWLQRLLTSRALWMKYPQWSKLAHLPLALKFWGLKLLAQYGWERYVQWERDCVTARLADLETRLIEERLPVPSLQATGGEADRDADAETGGVAR